MTDTEHLVAAYIDGALSAQDVTRIEAMMVADPALAARVERLRSLSALLRAACAETFYMDAPAPDGLAHPRIAPRRRLVAPRRAMLAAASAALAVFAGGGYWLTHWRAASQGQDHTMDHASDSRAAMLADWATHHAVFARETEHLVEVAADRATELLAWLGQRIGRRLIAPDLLDAGLTFAGGRMLVVAGQPVAHLLYQRAAGAPVGIGVYACAAPAAPREQTVEGGLSLVYWCDGTHQFAMMGQLPAEQAARIADSVARQMAG